MNEQAITVTEQDCDKCGKKPAYCKCEKNVAVVPVSTQTASVVPLENDNFELSAQKMPLGYYSRTVTKFKYFYKN